MLNAGVNSVCKAGQKCCCRSHK